MWKEQTADFLFNPKVHKNLDFEISFLEGKDAVVLTDHHVSPNLLKSLVYIFHHSIGA